ncbi:MAG: site-2 protease family protein [Candidatus Magasanikbacteria bacterium]|nr:site-2 protease family protein [Candidatus Magasanikbacteria bacterium]
MSIIFDIIIIVFSAILHEISHGLAARALGDKTAEYAGRLTLNPLVHIDLYGSIIMPIFLWLASGGQFMFAYAKPVPYNPYNLRNQQWGPALVGLAGPATNFVIAIAMALLVRSNFFAAAGIADFFIRVVVINVSLAIFNLVPIPPLDGSKVLYALMPERYNYLKYQFERYGMWIVLIFVFFFSYLLVYPIDFVVRLLIGA